MKNDNINAHFKSIASIFIFIVVFGGMAAIAFLIPEVIGFVCIGLISLALLVSSYYGVYRIFRGN